LAGVKAWRVTVVRVGQSRSYEAWWEEWSDWMKMYDFHSPFRFDSRVINGDRGDVEFLQDK
jgi:hypothetical protein